MSQGKLNKAAFMANTNSPCYISYLLKIIGKYVDLSSRQVWRVKTNSSKEHASTFQNLK